MKVIKSKIDGCYELQPIIRMDDRGAFIKTFHKDVFKTNNLVTEFAEEYYSVSKKNVLRGLHFQTPPMQHKKIVYCTFGSVIDVVVDLRKKSHTYGQYQIFELNSEKANMVYISEGLAHGFYTISDIAIMLYKVTSIYAEKNDCGILWSSVGIPWLDMKPIVSERDKNFIKFEQFKSPF